MLEPFPSASVSLDEFMMKSLKVHIHNVCGGANNIINLATGSNNLHAKRIKDLQLGNN